MTALFHLKKASISPIPLSLIALLISLIFLLAIYYLISGGLGALSSLVSDLHGCFMNPLECIVGIGA